MINKYYGSLIDRSLSAYLVIIDEQIPSLQEFSKWFVIVDRREPAGFLLRTTTLAVLTHSYQPLGWPHIKLTLRKVTLLSLFTIVFVSDILRLFGGGIRFPTTRTR